MRTGAQRILRLISVTQADSLNGVGIELSKVQLTLNEVEPFVVVDVLVVFVDRMRCVECGERESVSCRSRIAN